MSFHLNRFHLVVGIYPKEPLPQITPILLKQDLQVSEQRRAILRETRAELDAGGNEADGIAEVMANAIMNHNMDGVPLGNEQIDRISKLQLPAPAGSNTPEGAKTTRSKR